jgi:succinoglycan biosynthesis protein ExoA
VLDEESDIGRLLGELRQQQAPPGGFEVLVVDGGSRDRTREIVAARAADWGALRLLENPRRLSSAARNIGAAAARGRYLLYLDGHCALPRRDYLRRLLELFTESGAACLARPQPLLPLAAEPWARAIAAARHSPLGHNPGSDIYRTTAAYTDPRSAGAAYQRDLIRQLGGYDERFDACEDVEFNHRVAAAGLRAYCHPDLAVAYRPRATLGALFRQMARYGRGRARLLARHPTLRPWPLLILTLLALAVPVAVLIAGWRPMLLAAGALALLYLTATGFEALRRARPRRDAWRLWLAFPTIHAGLLAGFWRGLPDCGRYRRPPAGDRARGER